MNEESASDGYFLRLLAGDDSSLPLGLDLGPVNQNGYEDVSMHDSYAQPPGVVGGDTEWTASKLAPHNYADIATTATVNDYMTDFGQYDQTDYEELLAADMDELDYGGEESGSGTDEESTATATAGKATVKTKRHNLNENEDTEMPEEQEFAKYMQDAQKAAMEMQQEGGPLGKTIQTEMQQDFKADMAEFHNNLRQASGIGRARLRQARQPGTRQTTTAIPLQVKNLLQQANSLYVGDRETDAIPYLNEAIRLAPQVEHAWLLLALIKENQGEEERAFVLRFCAAQNARDPDLWCWVAEQLRKRNNPMHAVHCYTRALSLQPKDIGLLHARCEVYMEAGRIQRAIEGYETILKLQPEDEVAIHHLLRFYVERGRSHDAILLYERLMEETLPIEGPVDPPLFRWEQTNFLAELYMEIGDYERALLVIKRSVRRLQLRGTQIVWETRIDDVEYDEHPLPIDLRVKLGVCRLAIGEIAQAKMHFARLNGLPIVAHQELYHQMAEAYMEGELIHEAIEVYSIIAHEVKTDLQCRIHLSRCYRLLDNSDAAAEVLVEVANAMPKNRQVREELAKLYESLGEQELAVLYLSQANTLRYGERSLRRREKQPATTRTSAEEGGDSSGIDDPNYRYTAPETESDNQEDEDESENGHLSLIKKPKRKGKKNKAVQGVSSINIFTPERRQTNQLKALRRQEKALAHQREQEGITANHFHMLALLSQSNNTPTETDQYLEISQALYEIFTNAPILYPRGETDNDTEKRFRPNIVNNKVMHHSNVVLGKSTDDWLDFLMKYLLVLSHRGKWDHAHQVLRRIQQTSVFVIQDSWRVTSKLVEIVINLRQGEVEEAMHNARNLCRHIGVTHESLLFYNAIAPRYIDPIIAYGSSNAQKYVRRFILAMEAQAFQLSTSTTNTDSTDLLALLKPELFMLNASMSMVGKSYRLAIAYFTRAYRLSPFDPIVSLQLGISHLHRAMQRKTENRHAHILRGFAFFANYAQLRGHTQETAYNLGRAFQHIGLNFLAIPQYERAIRLSLSITNPINDLQRDAAYNLSLIYMSTGSPGLAQHLLYRYCTI